jgi:putative phosphoribosyl transferase
MFINREEAGKLLAKELVVYKNKKEAVIVTIPRGGVPIGYIIAKQLKLPLEIVLSKKIGHPLHKEFAIGAVTLNDIILSDAATTVSSEYIESETTQIRTVLKQRQHAYYENKTALNLKDKIVILVDDGVATGNTLISSIKLIEKQKPSQIIVGLPVGPASVIKKIKELPYVTKTICLLTPYYFQSVGAFYEDFNPVDDKEVIRLLKASANN